MRCWLIYDRCNIIFIRCNLRDFSTDFASMDHIFKYECSAEFDTLYHPYLICQIPHPIRVESEYSYLNLAQICGGDSEEKLFS